ncbi:MAG: hypothetical protein K8R90_03530 [Candidatus Cloacimonetes bacterium]|nr:hypothetical protein [Candidatus Cloacimonadota bacterium]
MQYKLVAALLCALCTLSAMPIRQAPGLEQVVVWERTAGTAPRPQAFSPQDARLGFVFGPLTPDNCDFSGVPDIELYDVYYSDELGVPDIDGEFVSVSCTYPRDWPASGACNVARVDLRFGGGRTVSAVEVMSFVTGGRNARASWVAHSVDGNLNTHSTMGSTGEVERLRLTFRFFELVTGRPGRQGDNRLCRM